MYVVDALTWKGDEGRSNLR